MGVLDDIFGTQTTAATDAATAAAQSSISDTTAQNNAILRGMTTKANSALNTGAAGATSAVNSGYGAGTGALTSYGGQAQATLGNGVNNAVNTVQGSNSNYTPYTTAGGAASGVLSNALGLNGASGNAAATAAFQASPGYQYSVNQATDAATRAAAATGMGASGNTLQAVTTLGQNLANQNYQTWLSNLQGVGAQGLTAAAGISGNNQAAGGAELQGGTSGAGLLQSTGQNIGTLDAAQGTALGNISTGLGGALSGNFTGLGNSLAGSNLTGAINVANLGVADANAQDTAANANAGILGKAVSTFAAPETKALTSSVGGALSAATGGWL